MKDLIQSLSKNGYLYTPRNILQTALNQKPGSQQKAALLYLTLLTFSAYKEHEEEHNGKRIRLQPGEIITTVRRLEEHTGIHFTCVSRMLRQFEQEELIRTRTWKGKQVIQVVDYRKLTHPVVPQSAKPKTATRSTSSSKPCPIEELERRFKHMINK